VEDNESFTNFFWLTGDKFDILSLSISSEIKKKTGKICVSQRKTICSDFNQAKNLY
jgi:hypothetical protein